MAEGYLRSIAGSKYEAVSAGTEPTRVHPLAIRAMQGVGIDISGHTSKGVKPFREDVWHDVITACDHANEHCPIFPFPSQRLHWGFPAPSQATGTEEERLQVFRRVAGRATPCVKRFQLSTIVTSIVRCISVQFRSYSIF